MPTRDARIAVSKAEKKKLDRVAEDLVGDDSIAYGAVVSMLADEHLEDSN